MLSQQTKAITMMFSVSSIASAKFHSEIDWISVKNQATSLWVRSHFDSQSCIYFIDLSPAPTITKTLHRWTLPQGTNLNQDSRFSDKEKKLMKQMKFSDVLSKKVDMSKVKLEILKPWINEKITQLLKLEDDVVEAYVVNQLEAEKFPNAKKMQWVETRSRYSWWISLLILAFIL